jgi:hypothetical protein
MSKQLSSEVEKPSIYSSEKVVFLEVEEEPSKVKSESSPWKYHNLSKYNAYSYSMCKNVFLYRFEGRDYLERCIEALKGTYLEASFILVLTSIKGVMLNEVQ